MRKLGVFIFSLGLLCSSYEAHCGGGMSKIAKAAAVGVATGGVGWALGILSPGFKATVSDRFLCDIIK